MWELVQAETSRRTSLLDLDVANALQRMWKVEEGGALRTWQPGAKSVIPGIDNIYGQYMKRTIRRSGTGRVVGGVDGSVYEGVDGSACSWRHAISSCA
jgi:hypothetical protein